MKVANNLGNLDYFTFVTQCLAIKACKATELSILAYFIIS